MTLKEYLASRKVTQEQAAKEIGIHPVTFNNICNGKRCSASLSQLISSWSQGEVAQADLMTNKKTIVKCPTCGRLHKE